jgi:hypothetical protein
MSALERLPDACPAHRADVWAAASATTRVHYRLAAEIEADVLCRVLNLFAMQYLIPQQVKAQQLGDTLVVEVELAGVSWHRAQVIAEKMRNLISVFEVSVQPMESANAQAFGALHACG